MRDIMKSVDTKTMVSLFKTTKLITQMPSLPQKKVHLLKANKRSPVLGDHRKLVLYNYN